MNDILSNIKMIREKKHLSQEFVAEAMGITQASYALIESGKRELKYRQLQHIAIAFDENVIDIITHPVKFVKASDSLQKRRVMIEIDLHEEEYQKIIKSKIK